MPHLWFEAKLSTQNKEVLRTNMKHIENPTVRRVLIGVTILAGVVLIFMSFKWSFGPSAAAQLTNHRMFVCSKTGKAFPMELEAGMTIPVRSPYSGENTGYPAEACYWTADGQFKDTPDYVLLNSEVGKPGPTFCPVCGRLVVGRNPRPLPGSKPPPTQAEYQARVSAGR
jgi:hypothetical protein